MSPEEVWRRVDRRKGQCSKAPVNLRNHRKATVAETE